MKTSPSFPQALNSPLSTLHCPLQALHNPLSTIHVVAAALLAASLLTGCTLLTYTTPTGEHFTRSSLGTQTSVAQLSVESDTNGVRRVELRGYQNDSTQALGTVTDAAVKAAIQAAK